MGYFYGGCVDGNFISIFKKFICSWFDGRGSLVRGFLLAIEIEFY